MSRVTSLGGLLFAAVLVWCPGTIASAQALDRPHSDLEPGVDPSIRPGDDFFAYANGGWLQATEIPAGKDRWSARNEISELTRQQVAKLLDDAGAAPVGSTARKVADFRAAYLNEAAIEARGIAPLEPLLDSIDHVGDKAALTRFLGRGLRADVDPLNWGVYQSSCAAGLVGGTGHPRREDLRRLSAAGRAGPAGPRVLRQHRASHAGPQSQIPGVHRPPAGDWPAPTARSSGPKR